MKRLILTALLIVLHATLAHAETSTSQERVFFLEDVRSGRFHGPFRFQTGSRITLETGTFQLDVLTANGNFLLTDTKSESVFGVYELVAGRIIDVGNQLFTIARISYRETEPPKMPVTPPVVPQQSPSSRQHVPRPTQYTAALSNAKEPIAYAMGLIVDLRNQIAYNGSIDGQDTGSAKFIERTGATFLITRGYFSASASLLMDGSWEESMDDIAGRYSNGRLVNGTGWNVGIHMDIPVFSDGYWSAYVGGGLQHQQESFDLEYDVRINNISTSTNSTSTSSTNTATTQTTVISDTLYIRQARDATLTETWINLHARVAYNSPVWFVYAGIHAMPWRNTELDANLQTETESFPLSLEQKDPLSGFAGTGMYLGKTRAFAEIEAGGINALRVGIITTF